MNKIRRHIRKFIAVEPDAKKLWAQIESGLLVDGLYSEINRSTLEKAIKELPFCDPQKDIWQEIEQSIIVPDANKKIGYRNGRLLKIAATVVFLLTSYLLIRMIIPEVRQHNLNSLKSQPIESFLATLCTKYPRKCLEPDFIELKTEIIRLNDEKSEIEKSMFFNPADASISKITDRIDFQMSTLRTQIMDYVE